VEALPDTYRGVSFCGQRQGDDCAGNGRESEGSGGARLPRDCRGDAGRAGCSPAACGDDGGYTSKGKMTNMTNLEYRKNFRIEFSNLHSTLTIVKNVGTWEAALDAAKEFRLPQTTKTGTPFEDIKKRFTREDMIESIHIFASQVQFPYTRAKYTEFHRENLELPGLNNY